MRERAGYSYVREKAVDFDLIKIEHLGRIAAFVYIGANPDLRGANEQLFGERYVHSHPGEKVWLTKSQSGQLLGVPQHPESEDYFHIVFTAPKNTQVRNDIVKIVDFC